MAGSQFNPTQKIQNFVVQHDANIQQDIALLIPNIELQKRFISLISKLIGLKIQLHAQRAAQQWMEFSPKFLAAVKDAKNELGQLQKDFPADELKQQVAEGQKYFSTVLQALVKDFANLNGQVIGSIPSKSTVAPSSAASTVGMYAPKPTVPTKSTAAAPAPGKP